MIRGIGCEMCENYRREADGYGIRILHGLQRRILQRADVQRGYTVVIWRGRYVNEPTELDEARRLGTGRSCSRGSGTDQGYKPLKMIYETLGNSLPHLHTHLAPVHDDAARASRSR